MTQEIKELKEILKECDLTRTQKVLEPGLIVKMRHRKKILQSLIDRLSNENQGTKQLFE